MGWRYLLFALGGLTLLMWALRLLAFRLEESPRFLVGRGRDAEAVEAVRRVAARNGRETRLTVAMLAAAAEGVGGEEGKGEGEVEGEVERGVVRGQERLLSASSVVSAEHVRSLFRTRRLAWSTALLIALWGEGFWWSACAVAGSGADACVRATGIIGLASTLYNSFLPYLWVSYSLRSLRPFPS